MRATVLFALASVTAVAACASSPETSPMPEPPRPVVSCDDAAKAHRCLQDRPTNRDDWPGNVAVCYDDGHPGPRPSDAGPWPWMGCAAPPEDNTAGAAGTWLWWCCDRGVLADAGAL